MRAATLYNFISEPEAETAIAQALASAQEHGFINVINPMRVRLGWLRAQHGHASEGAALIGQSVASMIEVGARLQTPGALICLARAQALEGATSEALATLESALRQNPDMTIVAIEGLAFRGELQLRLSATELAEADFRSAIALAQKTGAKSLELRATTSLARLLQARGDVSTARAVLAPLYDWFTEGFDTRDLIEAKATLEARN